MGVWSKGLKLFMEDEVDYDRKNNGVIYFNVKDYIVKVRKWNIIDCGCHYGVTHGLLHRGWLTILPDKEGDKNE